MQIHGSTACFPGRSHAEAVARLVTASEPLFGRINMEHVQLCPQNYGLMNEEAALSIAAAFPKTDFRLHANVRVGDKSFPGMGDASDLSTNAEHFRDIASVNKALGADVYSLHAGKRAKMTLEQMRAEVWAYSADAQMTVAVEGMYPDSKSTWLINSWDEYEWLLESGLHYALDLSHINILAHRSADWRGALVREMLACERCVEVHISNNDGKSDRHDILTLPPVWWPLLVYTNPRAVVFTEGNQLR